MPNASLDPYATLGLARGATAQQVARAYRRLAKEFHPDLNPGEGAERMRRLNEAWAILSSTERRAAYDAAHPAVPLPANGHWGASRERITPAQPTSTRTWASWRATADETRAAPRTVRQPGEVQLPPTRRPRPLEPQARGFRDSGWAALLVAAVILAVLAAAVVASKLA